jgi:hypothetical protein
MADPFDDIGQYHWSPRLGGNPRDPLVETETSRALKAHRRVRARSRFMPAISCDDAFRWHRVGPHALIIMMVLKRWRAIDGEFPTIIGDQLLGEIGILPQTRDRALAALEKAGFVMVDRQRGRLPRIWLVKDAVP